MLGKTFKLGIILSILVSILPTIAQQKRNLTRETDGIKRLALVIGNGNYLSARKLTNPTNDATDMAAALNELGFEVISGTNLNLKQMKEKVREFGDKLKVSGGVGFFYYAGHGIQVNGRNFLIPIEADIPREDEIGDAALNLNLVLQKMETANNGLNIVVLDACRNNPFSRSWSRDVSDAGLANINAPKGTFIAYATSPDTTASDGTGRNGLYTAELLKYIKQPNLKIEETFKEVTKAVDSKSNGKQTPWFSSSLRGEFIFKPNTDAVLITKPNSMENSASLSLPVSVDAAKQNKFPITGSIGSFDYLSKGRIESLFKKGSPNITQVRSAIVNGNLFEIKDKRKVYLSAYSQRSFSIESGVLDSAAKKMIVDKLTRYGGLEIVENPEAADFIIHYSGEQREAMTIDRSSTIEGNMIVMAREQSVSGSSDKVRILWKDKESQTYNSSAGLFILLKRHPADSLIRHFIKALKDVRGEK